MKRILGVLVLVALLDGCGATPTPTPTPTPIPTSIPTATPIPPCNVQAAGYLAEVEEYFDEWDDTDELAQNTARIALSPIIGELQEIRRDVGEVEPPACAEPVHKALLAYMDKEIEALLAFMRQGAWRTRTGEAQELFDIWSEEYAKLVAGEEPYD